MIYQDRTDAGQRLARLLEGYRQDSPLVLALPRGGVVVGYEIARVLRTPLDVLIVRKLGSPTNPEFGFGAIASGGVRYIDESSVRALGLSPQRIEQIVEREKVELERRSRLYRGDRPEPKWAARTVILTDDGLATGGTARAAIRAIRQAQPAKLILAVPVAPADTAEVIKKEVDDFVCPMVREEFFGISQWYLDFEQTTDEQVIELLRSSVEVQ